MQRWRVAFLSTLAFFSAFSVDAAPNPRLRLRLTGTSVVATGTWNPADKNANVALSNGNLTATASISAFVAVRSTTSHSTGKWCYEATLNAASGTISVGWGTSAASLSLIPGFDSPSNISVGWFSGGPIFPGPAGSATWPSLGSPGMLCVSLVTMEVWMLDASGNWNGSGTANPATDTGGLSWGASTGSTWFAEVGLANSGDNMTVNFGATAFAHALPSGFSAWG